jgi:hypothetical protein
VPESDGVVAISAPAEVAWPKATPDGTGPITSDPRATRARVRVTYRRLAKLQAPCVWALLALAFNIVWYGVFVSFPLLGEDGAANYSSLIDAVRTAGWISATFPIKWSEGLGQPNPFTPLTFDPFAWLMLTNMNTADAFRVSFAIRATVCWLGTYLFVSALFRGPRTLALSAAFVCLLIEFMLANVSGSNTFAAVDVATQAALFPLVLWLYVLLTRSSWRLSWLDAVFAAALTVLLLSYPIHSGIALVVLGIFAVAQYLTSSTLRRPGAATALSKLVLISSALLLAPTLGVTRAWTSISAVSARLVFADELTTYIRQYELPYFWHDVPIALGAIIVIALGVVILRRQPRPLMATELTLVAVVAGTQLETLLRFYGVFGGLLERLPRPFYTEFYLPPFYAIAAAYMLSRWHRGLSVAQFARPRSHTLYAHVQGTLRRASIDQVHRALGLLLGAAGMALVFVAVASLASVQAVLTQFKPDGVPRTAAGVGLGILLVVGAWIGAEWLGPRIAGPAQRILSRSIHVMTGLAARSHRLLDPARLIYRITGVTAASTADVCSWVLGLVAFLGCCRLVVQRWDLLFGMSGGLLAIILTSRLWPLRYRRLSRHIGYAAPYAAVVALAGGAWATWQFVPQQIHPLFGPELTCQNRTPWCSDPVGRTMGAASTPITQFLTDSLSQDNSFRGRADYLLTPGLALVTFPMDPTTSLSSDQFATLDNWYLQIQHADAPWDTPIHFTPTQTPALIAALRSQAERGVIPEHVVLEIVDWVQRNRPELTPLIRFANWSSNGEVSFVVAERNLNFRATGNGMLLRALSLQGVPIGSSYELSLDYLYYLLWTRYLNEGSPARRSINMTNLEEVRSDRLALLGVRLVVARNVPLRATPDLAPVWTWGDYSVYEIPDVNTTAYGVTRVLFASDLTDELRIMRDSKFDPREAAVAPEAERTILSNNPASQLSPLRSSSLTLKGQAIEFSAISAGESSVAVLPFKYSHCWEPIWSGTPGRILRLDVGLLGVSFRGSTNVALTWKAGYLSGVDCLNQDARLLPQAREAARQLK